MTSSRAVVVCTDPHWVRVRFSVAPGPLPAPWEIEDSGWVRAPRGAEPGLRDASADPVLVVVGVSAAEVVAINALAIDEIGVTCSGREALIAHWMLQAQVQGAGADGDAVAGAVLSENPDATVVVADPITGERGWVDVLAGGTAWPVRPLKTRVDDRASSVGVEPVGSAAGVAAAESLGSAPVDGAAAAADGGAGVAEDVVAQPVPGAGSMQVFGGFAVLDGDGLPLQPMQQDLVGAIAFNAPVSTQDLCALLFGTTQRPASFHVALSKMRRRGVNPVLTDGRYRIDIDSDWGRFTALAGPDPAAADTADLIAAAALVSGPLFGVQPPRWAAPLLEEMRAQVGAVCRELAARHSDQPQVAARYVGVGLGVDGGNAELSEIGAMLSGQLSGEKGACR